MSEAEALTCDRCGLFLTGDAWTQVLNERLCPACTERAHGQLRAVRLYSAVYVGAWGVAANLGLGAGLAALDWHRLGERRRAVQAAAVSVLGLIFLGWSVGYPGQLSAGIILPVNIAGMVIAARGLKARVAAQRAAGGKTANRLIPVLLMLVLAGLTGLATLLERQGY